MLNELQSFITADVSKKIAEQITQQKCSEEQREYMKKCLRTARRVNRGLKHNRH